MNLIYQINGLTCNGCVLKVKSLLENHSNIISANVSLEKNIVSLSTDRNFEIEELQSIIGNGKYRIISIESKKSKENNQSFLQIYKPLLLIFLFISIVSIISSIDNKIINLEKCMRNFMAGFFIVFSFFKFLDLKGFADSYSMYDILAIKFKIYGFIYPFIEFLLGIAYLTNYNPKITNISTIIIMGFSSIGVVKSVINKKRIRCACLGAVFNLPMSSITIIENSLMILMAFIMIL